MFCIVDLGLVEGDEFFHVGIQVQVKYCPWGYLLECSPQGVGEVLASYFDRMESKQ